MESESLTGSAALDTVRSVRERAGGMPRPFAWLLLWGAVLISAYLGVWLFISAVGPSSTWVTISLLLPTVLLYSLLVQGARERFGSRLRFRRTTVAVAVAAIVLVFFGLGGISLFGGGYPWWIAPLFTGIALVILGAKPALLLLRHRTCEGSGDPWRSSPLGLPAKVLTSAFGCFFGLSVGLGGAPIAQWALTMAGLLLFVVAASAPRARWGIARAGYEWGRLHWIAFGVTVAAVYAVAIVGSVAPSPPVAVSIACGILIAIPLIVAALLPRPH
ncbi:hypothetical protein AB1K54_16180 [Microbacterium sp. BWT-B31]|uniref:hypothetical protein n=1 Tax=Microbacterium sp. BWT-B31 TaxID=3232072 RepID=UPI003528C91A